MTTETAMLKDIVLPPTLMRRLLNVAGVSGCGESSLLTSSACASWNIITDLVVQRTVAGVGSFHGAHTLAKTEYTTCEQRDLF